PHPHLLSFPTRRSSDLTRKKRTRNMLLIVGAAVVTTALIITVGITALKFTFGSTRTDLNTEIVTENEAGFAYTEPMLDLDPEAEDRKSTRLNSSHVKIS